MIGASIETTRELSGLLNWSEHEQTPLSNCHLYGCSTHDVRICLRGRSNPRTGLQTCANNVAGTRLQLDRSLRWRERRRRMG